MKDSNQREKGTAALKDHKKVPHCKAQSMPVQSIERPLDQQPPAVRTVGMFALVSGRHIPDVRVVKPTIQRDLPRHLHGLYGCGGKIAQFILRTDLRTPTGVGGRKGPGDIRAYQYYLYLTCELRNCTTEAQRTAAGEQGGRGAGESPQLPCPSAGFLCSPCTPCLRGEVSLEFGILPSAISRTSS